MYISSKNHVENRDLSNIGIKFEKDRYRSIRIMKNYRDLDIVNLK